MSTNPLNKQIGGDHYKKMKIQPRAFIEANEIKHGEASAIEYIVRHENKNGAQDIMKAIENLQLVLKFRYELESDFKIKNKKRLAELSTGSRNPALP